MCEESACLVPPLETGQNAQAETRPSFSVSSPTGVAIGVGHQNLSTGNGSGEALVGFHEDALSQAATGKAQLLLAIALGLGLAADCSEITILGYIMPAAELQLCIGEHRKGWLVSITLLAMAGGSLAWGILGDHLGRRRALISALSVAALFSAVASVMPTYGTFMTARFCSGLGVSGAFPLTFSYLTETCSRSTRSSILPEVACIVGLIWASESPRYLLEASREVEALAVYQRLHRLNKARTQYGLTELELPGRAAYRDRPASPTRNVLNQGVETFRQAFQRVSSPTHFRTTLLLASLHFLLGFLYMGVSTFSSTIIKDLREHEYFLHKQYDICESHDRKCGVQRFIDTDLTDHHFINCNLINNTFLSLVSGCNVDFDYNIYLDDLYDETLTWAGYLSKLFSLPSRRTLLSILNKIPFKCGVNENSFKQLETTAKDMKSLEKYRILMFDEMTLQTELQYNSIGDFIEGFVDFGQGERRINYANHALVFMLKGIYRKRKQPICFCFSQGVVRYVGQTGLHIVATVSDQGATNVAAIRSLLNATNAHCLFMFPSLLFMGFVLETATRPPVATTASALAAIAAAGMFISNTAFFLTTVEMAVKILLACALNAVTMAVIEGYPCTAHGMMRSLYHIASLCAIPIYSTLVHTMLLFPTLLTISLAIITGLLCTRIQDNSKVLLYLKINVYMYTHLFKFNYYFYFLYFNVCHRTMPINYFSRKVTN
nr:unnamed protein product [Callosobruchus analis]